MPRTKNLTRYPLEYATLLIRAAACTRPEGVIIPNESPRQATSLRGTLYAYMRACERDPEGALALGITPQIVGATYITVEGNNTVLRSKEYAPSVLRIKQALAALEPPPATTPMSPEIERLLQLQKEVNDAA